MALSPVFFEKQMLLQRRCAAMAWFTSPIRVITLGHNPGKDRGVADGSKRVFVVQTTHPVDEDVAYARQGPKPPHPTQRSE